MNDKSVHRTAQATLGLGNILYEFFHRIGPLGRFGLVVAMSVCLFVCLSVCLSVCGMSPFHAIFFKVLKSKDFSFAMILFINNN